MALALSLLVAEPRDETGDVARGDLVEFARVLLVKEGQQISVNVSAVVIPRRLAEAASPSARIGLDPIEDVVAEMDLSRTLVEAFGCLCHPL